MKTFESSRIIITGAGSGIGKELVRQLYPKTKRIMAVDLSDENLGKLEAEFPLLEAFIVVDLSKKEGNFLILEWVKKNWQGLEFCFANAGKAEYQSAELQNWQHMEKLFQLNVFSPIQLGMELRKLYPDLEIRHVITCSAIAFWAVPGYSIYGATKAAILQWARTIWTEKSGDWLTLVFPISTSTAFFDSAGKEIPKAFPIQQPQVVARKILSGVSTGKKKIFPSLLFRVLLHLNNFLYGIRPLFQAIESNKFQYWVAKQKESSKV